MKDRTEDILFSHMSLPQFNLYRIRLTSTWSSEVDDLMRMDRGLDLSTLYGSICQVQRFEVIRIIPQGIPLILILVQGTILGIPFKLCDNSV